MTATHHVTIPAHLLPTDGRFGCGPSLVRAAQVEAITRSGVLGTSHRQLPVRSLVSEIQTGLTQLFTLPEGYEVVLGNGGATTFWDCAAVGLVRNHALTACCGEFSAKAHAAVAAVPYTQQPVQIEAPPGTSAVPHAAPDVDAYFWAHNETSTGVVTPTTRPTGIAPDALTIIDGTSAAGGIDVDLSDVDVYYFSPQKCFGSDGGLWFALMSPRALERARVIADGERWIPSSLSLTDAIDQSRQHQTPNTPALATLAMFAEQLTWMLAHGGLRWASGRCQSNASALYTWAEQAAYATPFVANPLDRSPTVATIDLDASVNASRLVDTLRTCGIYDINPYRKLGRNQVRVALFPAIDTADIRALTACMDYVVEHLS